jgi:chemotaxis protein methyltransferase CheR
MTDLLPPGSGLGSPVPPMTDEECRLLSEFVRERFGLELLMSQRDRVRFRLRTRLEVHAMTSFLEYYRYLVLSPEAKEEMPFLAEALTNNETYFFREAYQFEAFFGSCVLPRLAGRPLDRPIRILSAGCSSGEEPYSLAITYLENQFRYMGRGCEIEAFDLNAAKIKQCEAGEYDGSSFRMTTPEVKSRYFTPGAVGRSKLKGWVRTPVKFRVLNLLDMGSAFEPGSFDAVFCRNVLIYFSEALMFRICGTFHKLLGPDGLLFLGHSESLLGRTPLFRPQRAQDFIYYVKVDPRAGIS